MKRTDYEKELTKLYWMAVEYKDVHFAYLLLKEHTSEIDILNKKSKDSQDD